MTTTDEGSFCSVGKRSVSEGKLDTTSHKRRMKELCGEGYKEQTDSEIKMLLQEPLGMKLDMGVSGVVVSLNSKNWFLS